MITNTQVLLDVLSPFQPALFGKPGTIHYSSVGNNTSFLEPGRMYIIPCDQFLTFPEKSRAAAFICYGDSSVFRPELAPKIIPVILLQQPAQPLRLWVLGGKGQTGGPPQQQGQHRPQLVLLHLVVGERGLIAIL